MAERIRRRKKIDAPFPGLRPFMSGENLIFFGREGQSNELIDRLRKNHFLAVLGSSGSGKSSLVRAGLQPDLEGGLMAGVPSTWKIATMRPGDRPIANLAEELAQLVSDPDDVGFQVIPPATMIMTMLQASSFGLKEAALGPILKPEENLLVIVDQFEEIFRFNDGTNDAQKLDEAKSFVRLLLEASMDPLLPVYVVITMRSDFLGECPRFNGLAEAINSGQYLVPRLNRNQMREAITSPVAVFQESIAPDLVIRILNDIGENADQLPILQHALMRTWDHHCKGSEIVMADYDEIGGLANALNQHAEEIYSELDRQGLGGVTEQLFKSLTQLEGEGKGIRRPTRIAEICAATGASLEQVRTIVEAFRGYGRTFLMPPAGVDLDPETIVDISHESFMRLWLRLVAWVKEETQSADEYLRLSGAASDFRDGKVNLWRQPELGIALKWRLTAKPDAAWAKRYDDNFDAAMAFLDQSQKACLAEDEEKAAMLLLQQKSEQRKTTVRRLAILIVLMGGMLTIAIGALIFARLKYKEAKHQREYAEEQRQRVEQSNAVIGNLNSVLALRSDSLRQRTDSLNLVTDSLAVQMDVIKLQRAQLKIQVGATQAQLDSITRIKNSLDRNRSELAKVNNELKSQNAVQAALTDSATAARTRAENRTALMQALQLAESSGEASNRVTAALLALRAFHLNQEYRGDSGEPKIYNALQGALEQYGPMVRRTFPVALMAMDYDPLQDFANVLTINGSLYEFRDENGETHFTPKPNVGLVDLRFISHGHGRKSILVGDLAHRLLVYRSNGGYLEHTFLGHSAPIAGAIEIVGQGKVVSCDIAGRVIVHNLDGGPEGKVIHNDALAKFQAMAISSDSKMIAVSKQKEILIFNTATLSITKSIKVNDFTTSMAFSNDGRTLAFGTEKGFVGYFDFVQGGSFVLPWHRARVSCIAFSPDGAYLVSGSYDQTLRMWRVGRLKGMPIVLKGHQNWVTGLGFSKDSRKIYSISKDKTMRYWYTRTADLVQDLEAAAPRQQFNAPEVEQYHLDDRDVKAPFRK